MVPTDNGPNANAKARITRNGPSRINQRLFRQNFRNLVYNDPEKNFMDTYRETKRYLFDIVHGQMVGAGVRICPRVEGLVCSLASHSL